MQGNIRKRSAIQGHSVSSQIFKTHRPRSYKSQCCTGGAEGCFPSVQGTEGLLAPQSKGRLGQCQGQVCHANWENYNRGGIAAVRASARARDGSRSLWGSWQAGWLLKSVFSELAGASWQKGASITPLFYAWTCPLFIRHRL